MTKLEAHSIRKAYGERTILDDVSLHVQSSEFLVIVGQSGTGKSTLLRILAGLEQQDEGEVTLDGNEVLGPKRKLVPGHEEIQLAHQGFELHPHMSAKENIERSLLAYQEDYRAYRTSKLLELADLSHAGTSRPRELSGGQQQKLSIATALASEPKVLLLDEPFSNLDPFSRDRFLQEIKQSAYEMGTAIVLVTHDTREALSVADRLMVLEDARISQEGSPEAIYRSPVSRSIANFFGRVNYFTKEQADVLWPSVSGQDFVWMGIRPEHVRLQDEGAIKGTVSSHSYQGATYLVRLVMDDQRQLLLTSNVPSGLGAHVSADIDLAHAMFFRRDL